MLVFVWYLPCEPALESCRLHEIETPRETRSLVGHRQRLKVSLTPHAEHSKACRGAKVELKWSVAFGLGRGQLQQVKLLCRVVLTSCPALSPPDFTIGRQPLSVVKHELRGV